MSSPETNNPQQDGAQTRQVTVTVPEHRAAQFEALARRVLAVWEYGDTYGLPRMGRRGRHRHRFGPRGPGGARHARCGERAPESDQEAGDTGVQTA